MSRFSRKKLLGGRSIDCAHFSILRANVGNTARGASSPVKPGKTCHCRGRRRANVSNSASSCSWTNAFYNLQLNASNLASCEDQGGGGALTSGSHSCGGTEHRKAECRITPAGGRELGTCRRREENVDQWVSKKSKQKSLTARVLLIRMRRRRFLTFEGMDALLF